MFFQEKMTLHLVGRFANCNMIGPCTSIPTPIKLLARPPSACQSLTVSLHCDRDKAVTGGRDRFVDRAAAPQLIV